MSEQPKYFKIGLFVIGSVCLAVASIIVLGSGILRQEKIFAETYVDESVQGLEVGSPVKLRGVKMGQVEEITFVDEVYKTDFRYILVRMSLAPRSEEDLSVQAVCGRLEKEIDLGLRVRLAYQGLTGGVYIEADYLDPERYPSLELDWEPSCMYIPSAPSLVAGLSDSVVSLLDKLDRTEVERLAKDMDELVRSLRHIADEEARPAITDAREALKTMAESADVLRSSLTEILEDEVRPILVQARDVSGELPETVERLNETIRRVNLLIDKQQDRIDTTLANVEAASDTLKKMDELPETIDNVNRTLAKVNGLLESQQEAIDETVRNLRAASVDLKEMAEAAKRYPPGALLSQPPPRTR